MVRIQIAFKTIQTPETEEFEQGNLNAKRLLLRSSSSLLGIQITFKTIRTPGRNFEQGDLNVKRTILHRTAQQVELNTGMKEFKNI